MLQNLKDQMGKGDQWSTRVSTSSSSSNSRRFQSSRSEVYLGGDDADADDDCKQEFLCPFCTDEFDVVGLFCHMEEDHPMEVRDGVCPVCAKRVGIDMVSHITLQHGNILKVQRKGRTRKGTSSSLFSLLKELQDVNLQSLLEGSSYLHFSPNSDADADVDPDPNPNPDPLLSSFIFNPSITEDRGNGGPLSVEASSIIETKEENALESSNERHPRLSGKDQEKKARRSEFVRQMLLSTILEDDVL
ncbi:hypothetical protein Dimus_028510 [Dionaea muscipula]